MHIYGEYIYTRETRKYGHIFIPRMRIKKRGYNRLTGYNVEKSMLLALPVCDRITGKEREMRRIVAILTMVVLLASCSVGPSGKTKPTRSGMLWKERPPIQTMMIWGIRP